MTDVLVVGCGLSGGLFARHVARQLPGASVTVVEPRALPPDPAVPSVGESTSEIGAWYLADALGLRDHLAAAHTPKLGLRFFLSRAVGAPFESRAELGIQSLGMGYCELPFTGTRPATWQLHRGRLDRTVHDENVAAGVTHLDATRVVRVAFGDPHRVTVDGPGGERVLEARWLVDASARGIASGPLGPLEPAGHALRAAWAWVDGRIDPDRFDGSAEFGARLPPDLRWRSTNHLVGERSWVWLIPLSDGRTSVGIVTHADAPCPSTPDAWIGWLDAHEPECAALIRAIGAPTAVHQRDVASTRASAIVGPGRVARTGDAAGFLDPLYSSALDHAALVNELVVAVIADDLGGRSIARRCRAANLTHGQLFAHYANAYVGLYDLVGDPRLFAAKITWDNAMYFSVVAPIVTSGRVADPDLFTSLGGLAQRAAALQWRMQAVFRTWAREGRPRPASGVVDVGRSPHLLRPLGRLRDRRPASDLAGTLADGLHELEGLAVALLRRAASETGASLPDGPLNPYAASLDPAEQGPLTRGRACVDVPPELERSLAATWLTP